MKRKRKVRVSYNMPALRLRAYYAQKGLCYWCKEEMKRTRDQRDPRQLTGDHLIPVFNGGKTIPGNIVAACRKCNSERHPEMNRAPRRRHDKSDRNLIASVGGLKHQSPFEVLKRR